ncbi:hypothetical protein [Paraburkholderia sacchari]|uniref:hypothetical protein n=1 Tax=Paraburkholderia sacchari TaxID=159450 RepID=UPI001BCBD705|nr:hypothetical protein [Paraburkholderia sacchari]
MNLPHRAFEKLPAVRAGAAVAAAQREQRAAAAGRADCSRRSNNRRNPWSQFIWRWLHRIFPRGTTRRFID